MLSDTVGRKIQEIDMLIVETIKSQQDLMVEIDSLQDSSKFLSITKRMHTLSRKLKKNLEVWNKLKIND
jgi:hypothetical protein